jgi:hypothetical protein
MWQLVAATLMFAGMWASPLAAQQTANLNALLDQLHASSAAITTSLPSFTCEEQAVSRSKDGDTVVKNVQLHSIYREIRNSDPSSSRLFLDSRTSPDDGTAISLGKLRPPFWEGGIYWAYSQNISPADRKQMVYEVIDPATLWSGAPAHVMEIAYRGRYEMTGINKVSWRTVKGMAWVDSTTSQLLRIEVRIMNVPSSGWITPNNTMTTTVDFAQVSLGPKNYDLPRRIHTELRDNGTSHSNDFTAEYSNCQLFTAHSRILPGVTEIQHP